MPVADILPPDEAKRMAAVRRYDILDSPPDGAFDRITAPADWRSVQDGRCRSIEAGVWFPSRTTACPSSRSTGNPGFAHRLSWATCLLDRGRAFRPAIASQPARGRGLRPALLRCGASDHQRRVQTGAFVVVDKEPRPVTPEQIEDLKDLASVVMDQLELGGSSARQAVGKANLMGKEIDHRVMNSLQFVSGMLTIQKVAHPKLVTPPSTFSKQRTALRPSLRSISDFYADACRPSFVHRLPAPFVRRLAAILDREIVIDGDEEMVPATSIQPIINQQAGQMPPSMAPARSK